MNQEATDKIAVARSRLLLDHPFFGVLALRLQLQPRPEIPTLAVDGKTIFYNPAFVNDLDMALCSSALAHEAMHCVLAHIHRRGAREPRKWNRACDYALNPILKDAGLPLGHNWLHNPAWAGMTADEIYSLLPDEPESSEGGALCEVMDGAADSDDLAAEWKLAAVQAAKQSQNHGRLPAGVRKLLDDVLTPPIPWRDVLARFMTERVKDDYSWRRPNPFYAHSGIYLPIMDGVGMGDVVIALDTSGSVISVLDEFGSTVKDILTAAKPRQVHVIYCDAEVNKVDTFGHGQEVTFEAVGGGGTDFRPVFDHVAQAGIRPECLLYLTDMYGSFPEHAPEYPVMWCATSGRTAPWGETLRIKD